MKTVITLILTVLLSGCSAVGYDLLKMPSYNQATADEEWKVISDLEAREMDVQMQLLEMLMSGGKLKSAEEKSVRKNFDVYLFNKAAAQVMIFNGDYAAAKEAASRAKSSLDEISKVVVNSSGVEA